MHNACPLSELAPGEALRLDTAPPLAAFNTEFTTEEGAIFAIDDTCTHHDASLAEGHMEDRRVRRPLHASSVSLRSEGMDQPPAKLPVRTHEVQIVDGNIMVIESGEAPNLPPEQKADGHV